MIFQISCFFIRRAELDKSVTTIQYMKSFFMCIKISKKSLMVMLFRVYCVPHKSVPDLIKLLLKLG